MCSKVQLSYAKSIKKNANMSQKPFHENSIYFPWHLKFLLVRLLETLGESGAAHDSQSVSRSGVEARLAQNLNGWEDYDA